MQRFNSTWLKWSLDNGICYVPETIMMREFTDEYFVQW